MRISDWSSTCALPILLLLHKLLLHPQLLLPLPRNRRRFHSSSHNRRCSAHHTRDSIQPPNQLLQTQISHRRKQPCTSAPRASRCARRSEEHTSELQSLMRISYAVFCLKQKTPKRQLQINKQT